MQYILDEIVHTFAKNRMRKNVFTAPISATFCASNHLRCVTWMYIHFCNVFPRRITYTDNTSRQWVYLYSQTRHWWGNLSLSQKKPELGKGHRWILICLKVERRISHATTCSFYLYIFDDAVFIFHFALLGCIRIAVHSPNRRRRRRLRERTVHGIPRAGDNGHCSARALA
jgi:hypothetical protein